MGGTNPRSFLAFSTKYEGLAQSAAKKNLNALRAAQIMDYF